MENKRQGHQADRLMELFQEISEHDGENNRSSWINNEESSSIEEPMIELDVLKLPPRKEVHQAKKQKFSFRFTRPFVRFMIVLIIMISAISFIFFRLGKELISFFY